MKKLIFFSLIFFYSLFTFGQNKRGLTYGYHSPEDLEVLSPNVSWWYNWSEKPENAVASVYENYGFEFVPMTWNGNFDSVKLVTFLADHPETKFLLAFNEPNFIAQANMTPSEAAAIWPAIESIADAYNLEIVAPAVNYCGVCVEENGITYNSPFDYLDDFFAACQDCRVDYIAVHSYMNTVSALQWYINEFKVYAKPIWLTEFAGWEQNGTINNVSDQINFMIGAVDVLESDSAVFRYSWFIGRGAGISNYPHIDLLGANGELTELGEAYVKMPVHNDSIVVDLPARIEAEAYNNMSGILLEKTADFAGFANVGYIDPGDWLEYKVNVPNDTTLPIHFRLASTKSSELELLIDGEFIIAQPISNTGGWQNWQSFENSIEITAGEHIIRLHAVTNGFNINWFDLGDITSGLTSVMMDKIKVYPNPATNTLKIETQNHKNCLLKVKDVMGKTILHQNLDEDGILDISKLDRGIYILIVEQGDHRISKKIIKN